MSEAKEFWDSKTPLERMRSLGGMAILCYGADFHELNEPEQVMIENHVGDPSSTKSRPIQWQYRRQ